MQKPTFTTGYEDLTLQERLLRILHAPRSSFESVRDEPTSQDWMLPVLLMCLVWIGSNYMTLAITTDLGLPANQERLRDLPEDLRDEIVKNNETWYPTYGWFIDPLVIGFQIVIFVGLAMFAVGRWVFRADVSLRQMLILKGYASVIVAVEIVIRTPMMLIAQDRSVQLGPAAFISDEFAQTYFGRMLSSATFFDMWQAVVIGIGLAVMAKVPTHRAVATVLLLWGILIATGAFDWSQLLKLPAQTETITE